MSNFSKEDQICTIRMAALAQTQAVTEAQKKLANDIIQYIETRLESFASVMETERDKRLASNMADLCSTELRNRYHRLLGFQFFDNGEKNSND